MVTLVKGVMKVFLLEQVDNEQKYINEYGGESWNGEVAGSIFKCILKKALTLVLDHSL